MVQRVVRAVLPRVTVRVDMHQGHRAVHLGVRLQQRQRDEVVAAQGDDAGSCGEQRRELVAHGSQHQVGRANTERDVTGVDAPPVEEHVVGPRPDGAELRRQRRLLADGPRSEAGTGAVGDAEVVRHPDHRELGRPVGQGLRQSAEGGDPGPGHPELVRLRLRLRCRIAHASILARRAGVTETFVALERSTVFSLARVTQTSGIPATPTIAPATGRLGVLTVGLGAVATTLIAGVELVKRGQQQADRQPQRRWARSASASAPTTAPRWSRTSCRWPVARRHRVGRVGRVPRRRLRRRHRVPACSKAASTSKQIADVLRDIRPMQAAFELKRYATQRLEGEHIMERARNKRADAQQRSARTSTASATRRPARAAW